MAARSAWPDRDLELGYDVMDSHEHGESWRKNLNNIKFKKINKK